MITITINGNGAYVASAMITDGLDTWLETRAYYGYSKREIRPLFRQYLADKRLKVSR